MSSRPKIEQHIAVFGESGSGKTALLSSFYGAAQEPRFIQDNHFRVVAEDSGHGTVLHRNYLGMRDSARKPAATRFRGSSYAFSVKMKDPPAVQKEQPEAFQALRLVWHDYPGEWFEENAADIDEAQRRIDTFKDLLGSDVAFLLVDAQRLLDNEGQEELYLKLLLANFRNSLLTLKDDLLEGGKPLTQFPRIWIITLSKADLLPNMDVFNFRDLLVEKAGEDINELRDVLAGLVEGDKALSVGEDFMLSSAAKFGEDKIEVGKRVGMDLFLPVGAVLPFVRHVRWAQAKVLPAKVGGKILKGAGAVAVVLLGRKYNLPKPLTLILSIIGPDLIEEASQLAGDKLEKANATALAKQEYMTATLTGFRMKLDDAEDEHILIRSPK